MTTKVPIKEVMTKGLITAKPSDSVALIAEIMRVARIGGVIITEEHDVKGIVTEGDIVREIVAKGRDARQVKAEDIMKHPIRSVDDDVDVEEAARIMRDLNIERIPVARDGKLVGIITQNDITKIEPALLEIMHHQDEIDAMREVETEATFSGICEMCHEYSDDLQLSENKKIMCKKCRGEL